MKTLDCLVDVVETVVGEMSRHWRVWTNRVMV